MLPPDLPTVAISVRQPWAFAIVYLGKDVENRSRVAIINGGMASLTGKRCAIHAAKGMTRDEYESARRFIVQAAGLGACPDPAELQRGGIIGHVLVDGIVRNHREAASPWWMGPRALRLRDPVACAFVPVVGALGAFTWAQSGDGPDTPAKWMSEWGKAKPVKGPEPMPLFEGR